MGAKWDNAAVVNYGPWYPPIEGWQPSDQYPKWWNLPNFYRKLTSKTDNGNEISLVGDCTDRYGLPAIAITLGGFVNAEQCFTHCLTKELQATGCKYEFQTGVCSAYTTLLAGSTQVSGSLCWTRGYISPELEELQKTYKENALEGFKESGLNFYAEHNNVAGAREKNIQILNDMKRWAYNFPANLRYGDSSSNGAKGHCYDPMGNAEGWMTNFETEWLKKYWDDMYLPSQCFITYTSSDNGNTCYTISSTGRHEVIEEVIQDKEIVDRLRWRIYFPENGILPNQCCREVEQECDPDPNANIGCCSGLTCEFKGYDEDDEEVFECEQRKL